jgi:hypothetical protein
MPVILINIILCCLMMALLLFPNGVYFLIGTGGTPFIVLATRLSLVLAHNKNPIKKKLK